MWSTDSFARFERALELDCQRGEVSFGDVVSLALDSEIRVALVGGEYGDDVGLALNGGVGARSECACGKAQSGQDDDWQSKSKRHARLATRWPESVRRCFPWRGVGLASCDSILPELV